MNTAEVIMNTCQISTLAVHDLYILCGCSIKYFPFMLQVTTHIVWV